MFYKFGEYMDLHIHSVYSDGKLTIPEILTKAQEAGLDRISITDHNTIDAYNFINAIDPKQYFSGEIVTGAEINVVVENNLLECLIYNFDIEKIKDADFLDKEWRENKARLIAHELGKKARRMGLTISDEYFKQPLYNTGFSEFYDELNSHSQNHKFLVKHKLLTKRDFFRNGFSVSHGIFSIDLSKYYITIEELKPIVNACGGTMVLAHPFGVYKIRKPKALIKRLAKNNLVDGFECIHYQINLSQTKFLTKLCNKYGLVKTAGSDFHKAHHVLGYSYMSNLKTIIDNKFHFA